MNSTASRGSSYGRYGNSFLRQRKAQQWEPKQYFGALPEELISSPDARRPFDEPVEQSGGRMHSQFKRFSLFVAKNKTLAARSLLSIIASALFFFILALHAPKAKWKHTDIIIYIVCSLILIIAPVLRASGVWRTRLAISSVLTVGAVRLIERVLSRNQCLVGYLSLILLTGILIDNCLVEAIAICVGYLAFVGLIEHDNNSGSLSWYGRGNILLISVVSMAWVLRAVMSKIDERMSECIRRLMVLKEKHRLEESLGNAVICAHLSEDLIDHMFPAVNKGGSLSDTSNLINNGSSPTKSVPGDGGDNSSSEGTSVRAQKFLQRKPTESTAQDDARRENDANRASQAIASDLILDKAVRRGIVPEFQEPRIPLSDLHTIGGVDRRDCILVVIKYNALFGAIATPRDKHNTSAANLLQVNDFHDFISVAAKAHRITHVRNFGDTWVGCMGLVNDHSSWTWGSAISDCMHAASMVCEVNYFVSNVCTGSVTMSVECGNIVAGFIDSLSLDIYGQEIRWALMMVELNLPSTIIVGDAFRHLLMSRQDEIEGQVFAEIEQMRVTLPWSTESISEVFHIINWRDLVDGDRFIQNLPEFTTLSSNETSVHDGASYPNSFSWDRYNLVEQKNEEIRQEKKKKAAEVRRSERTKIKSNFDIFIDYFFKSWHQAALYETEVKKSLSERYRVASDDAILDKYSPETLRTLEGKLRIEVDDLIWEDVKSHAVAWFFRFGQFARDAIVPNDGYRVDVQQWLFFSEKYVTFRKIISELFEDIKREGRNSSSTPIMQKEFFPTFLYHAASCVDRVSDYIYSTRNGSEGAESGVELQIPRTIIEKNNKSRQTLDRFFSRWSLIHPKDDDDDDSFEMDDWNQALLSTNERGFREDIEQPTAASKSKSSRENLSYICERGWIKHRNEVLPAYDSSASAVVLTILAYMVCVYSFSHRSFEYSSLSRKDTIVLPLVLYILVRQIFVEPYNYTVYPVLMIITRIAVLNSFMTTANVATFSLESRPDLHFEDLGGDVSLLLFFMYRIPGNMNYPLCSVVVDSIVLCLGLWMHRSWTSHLSGLSVPSLVIFTLFVLIQCLYHGATELRAYESYVLEHRLIPQAIRAYDAQRKNSAEILNAFVPQIFVGKPAAHRVQAKQNSLNCAVAALHIKPADILSGFLGAAQLAIILRDVYTLVDEAIRECGMIKITTFSGVVLAAVGDSIAWDKRTPQSHIASAVQLLRIIEKKVGQFSRVHRFNVAIGIGLDHGPATVGFLGLSHYCFDVSGITRDAACIMASYHSDGIFATNIFENEIQDSQMSDDLVSRIKSVDSQFFGFSVDKERQYWLRLDGAFSGVQLEDFTYMGLLGRGGYGSVHLVREKFTRVQYAVKVVPLKMGSIMSKMSKSECTILQMMQHPNVVNLKYSFVTKNRLYLVMTFIRGGNLKEVVARDKLGLSHLVVWFAELILAIEYVHNCGIIHRDIKPANCMISTSGHLLLGDFGLSKIVSTPAITSASASGSMNSSPNIRSIVAGRTEGLLSPARALHRSEAVAVSPSAVNLAAAAAAAPQHKNNYPSKKREEETLSFRTMAEQVIGGKSGEKFAIQPDASSPPSPQKAASLHYDSIAALPGDVYSKIQTFLPLKINVLNDSVYSDINRHFRVLYFRSTINRSTSHIRFNGFTVEIIPAHLVMDAERILTTTLISAIFIDIDSNDQEQWNPEEGGVSMVMHFCEYLLNSIAVFVVSKNRMTSAIRQRFVDAGARDCFTDAPGNLPEGVLRKIFGLQSAATKQQQKKKEKEKERKKQSEMRLVKVPTTEETNEETTIDSNVKSEITISTIEAAEEKNALSEENNMWRRQAEDEAAAAEVAATALLSVLPPAKAAVATVEPMVHQELFVGSGEPSNIYDAAHETAGAPHDQNKNSSTFRSRSIKNRGGKHSAVGTLPYIAPEILKFQSHAGKAADYWACACTIYFCVTRQNLFQGEDKDDIKYQILHADIDLSLLTPHGQDIVHLVRGMLNRDIKHRFGSTDTQVFKSHPLFAGLKWDKLHENSAVYKPAQFVNKKFELKDKRLFFGDNENIYSSKIQEMDMKNTQSLFKHKENRRRVRSVKLHKSLRSMHGGMGSGKSGSNTVIDGIDGVGHGSSMVGGAGAAYTSDMSKSMNSGVIDALPEWSEVEDEDMEDDEDEDEEEDDANKGTEQDYDAGGDRVIDIRDKQQRDKQQREQQQQLSASDAHWLADRSENDKM